MVLPDSLALEAIMCYALIVTFSEEGLMVKLVLSWDIKPGKEGEYFDFVMREFAPALMKMGVQIVEAWYTIFGNGPQIITGGLVEDVETARKLLESQEYKELKERLSEFVTNFQQKIVPARGRFYV